MLGVSGDQGVTCLPYSLIPCLGDMGWLDLYKIPYHHESLRCNQLCIVEQSDTTNFTELISESPQFPRWKGTDE